MRDDEPRLVDLLVAEEEEIEVDRARPPLPPGPFAAEAPLDVEQSIEEGARRRARVSTSATAFRNRGCCS